MTACIVVVDDHRVVRDGLREIIRQRPDFLITGEAASGKEALLLVRADPPDLLLLDISLPEMSGLEVLKTLRNDGSGIPVLFFSMHPADQYAAFAQRSGAQGFISKDAGANEILLAIAQVAAGRTYFPALGAAVSAPGNLMSLLSGREKEVLDGLVLGKTQIEIAKALGITNKSVGTYRTRILNKLEVSNNAELISLATRLGILS